MDVIITPNAFKQYKHLNKTDKEKIKKKLLALEKNPKEGKKLTGSLSKIRSLRAWPYRILYLINEKQNKLFVITIAHRQGVYR